MNSGQEINLANIASLCKSNFDKDFETRQKDLQGATKMLESIFAVNTENVQPLYNIVADHVVPIHTVPHSTSFNLTTHDALQNSKSHDGSYFVVKKVLPQ